jgi:hypothetical protein
MFGHKPPGPAGKSSCESSGPAIVNRRRFLRGVSLLGIASVFGLLRTSLTHAQLRLNFYQKAWARRNFTAKPIIVYKMVALPDRRYCNADLGHMANKVFPSIEAARAPVAPCVFLRIAAGAVAARPDQRHEQKGAVLRAQRPRSPRDQGSSSPAEAGNQHRYFGRGDPKSLTNNLG